MLMEAERAHEIARPGKRQSCDVVKDDARQTVVRAPLEPLDTRNRDRLAGWMGQMSLLVDCLDNVERISLLKMVRSRQCCANSEECIPESS